MDSYKISFRKLIGNTLARNSAIVFAGSMAANVLAYVYHLIMGRLLGPARYGELSSLLSIFYIFAVPLTVAQTVLVKYISGFKARGVVGQAKSLFLSVTKLFIIISLIGLPVILIAAPWITVFLHLSAPILFIFVYLTFVFSLLSIVPSSMLQGYQRFVWVSVFGVGAIAIKILLSVLLTGWGVYGVILAAVLAGALLYAFYFYPTRFVLAAKSERSRVNIREMFRFAIPTLLTLLGITSLYSTDIILVRHFFAAPEAGTYAAIAILGKVIFYASSAVSLVLFPVLSERAVMGTTTKKITMSAVSGVASVSIAITILYFLFPNFIVRSLFGNAYQGAGVFLGLFGIFIALFSVGNIIATACLALGRTGVWFISVICAILQIVSIIIWHTTLATVISLNILTSALFVLGTSAYYLKLTYAKI